MKSILLIISLSLSSCMIGGSTEYVRVKLAHPPQSVRPPCGDFYNAALANPTKQNVRNLGTCYFERGIISDSNLAKYKKLVNDYNEED